MRLTEIGQEFGILRYSSVSSIVTRTEKQLLNKKQLRNRIEYSSKEPGKESSKDPHFAIHGSRFQKI